MKTFRLLGAALLGLALHFSAAAQVPAQTAPGAVGTPGSLTTPATNDNGLGQPGLTGSAGSLPTGAVPASATTPTSVSGTALYQNGVPARNLNGATQRADQPVSGTRGGMPAVTGSQQTHSLNKRRTTTTTTTTTQP